MRKGGNGPDDPEKVETPDAPDTPGTEARTTYTPGQPERWAMIGYRLANTLSEHGTVARGLCEMDSVGYLTSIEELTAIDLLQPSATYEFAQPGISFYGAGGGSFGAMYPTYLRGEAYLALRRERDAASEFQKIVDHPGVVLGDPRRASGYAHLSTVHLNVQWTRGPVN